ncbi:hypothetical protein GCM10023191_036910 [Actinoallomurus oryzae]|uniref:Uncharacterized protein n=1 Tax=Actinoallomurus oryzae TaxID=502180 RepID=A0ABP8Q275_9ACTN
MQTGIRGAAGNTWGGAPRHPTNAHTGGYGTDADGDGWDDVYDPADAHYLRAHGAPGNIRAALFACNPSND